jgi:hypothetical protein
MPVCTRLSGLVGFPGMVPAVGQDLRPGVMGAGVRTLRIMEHKVLF